MNNGFSPQSHGSNLSHAIFCEINRTKKTIKKGKRYEIYVAILPKE